MNPSNFAPNNKNGIVNSAADRHAPQNALNFGSNSSRDLLPPHSSTVLNHTKFAATAGTNPENFSNAALAPATPNAKMSHEPLQWPRNPNHQRSNSLSIAQTAPSVSSAAFRTPNSHAKGRDACESQSLRAFDNRHPNHTAVHSDAPIYVHAADVNVASHNRSSFAHPPSDNFSFSDASSFVEGGCSVAGSSSTRFDNSLSFLTRKFISLLKEAPFGIIDLNVAAQKLGVQKRRIYDITNVLEGVGLIDKIGKNNIRLRATTAASSAATDAVIERLKYDIEHLRDEEASLAKYNDEIQHLLKKLSDATGNARYAYLNHVDIRNIPGLLSDTLFAVKAPYGSTLEVPDPEEGCGGAAGGGGKKRFEIQLASETGPIDVFLIQNMPSVGGDAAAASQPSQPPPHAVHAARSFSTPDADYNSFPVRTSGVHPPPAAAYGYVSECFDIDAAVATVADPHVTALFDGKVAAGGRGGLCAAGNGDAVANSFEPCGYALYGGGGSKAPSASRSFACAAADAASPSPFDFYDVVSLGRGRGSDDDGDHVQNVHSLTAAQSLANKRPDDSTTGVSRAACDSNRSSMPPDMPMGASDFFDFAPDVFSTLDQNSHPKAAPLFAKSCVNSSSLFKPK